MYVSSSYLVPASGLSLHPHNSVLCGTGVLNFIKTNLSFFLFHHLVFLNCFREIWVPQALEDLLYFVLEGLLWSFYIYDPSQIKFLWVKVYPRYLWMIQLTQNHLLKRLFLYNTTSVTFYHQTWTLSRCACILSHTQLFVTPWIATHKAPLSMVFSRQRYWTGLPFSSPEDLPDQGWNPCLLCLLHWQVYPLPLSSLGFQWAHTCESENSLLCFFNLYIYPCTNISVDLYIDV